MAEHKPYIDAAVKAVFETLSLKTGMIDADSEGMWHSDVSAEMDAATQTARFIVRIGNMLANGIEVERILGALDSSALWNAMIDELTERHQRERDQREEKQTR